MSKLDDLNYYFQNLGSVAIAFSGGVDSTFLLKVAHDVLGEKCIAVTEYSSFVPNRDISEAEAFCEKEKIHHIVLNVDPLSIEGVKENPVDRCYWCKKGLFSKIKEVALENGIQHVAEGSNMDDLGDYRPGLKAVAELGVKSPLRECGFTKAEIRSFSRELSLETWQKPSFACLASRVPYGTEITAEILEKIEKAEEFLFEQGFLQYRVRLHGNLARIEVLPEDLERLFALREKVSNRFKELGFDYVTMDLCGFKSGSLNVGLV